MISRNADRSAVQDVGRDAVRGLSRDMHCPAANDRAAARASAEFCKGHLH